VGQAREAPSRPTHIIQCDTLDVRRPVRQIVRVSIRPLSRRELFAYLAGAIDSDGTIGIKRSTYAVRVRKDSCQPTYSERLALRQVTPAVPELLRTTFGGSLYLTQPSAVGGKPLFSWSVTDQKAATCLRTLLPYLRVKRAQAENALALRGVKERSKVARVARGRGHVGAAPRRSDLSEAMETCYLKAKELNRAGVSHQKGGQVRCQPSN